MEIGGSGDDPYTHRSTQNGLRIVVIIQTAHISSCGPQRTSADHTAIQSFDCVTSGVILLFVDFDIHVYQ